MTEANIVHENGNSWVCKTKTSYNVMRPYGTTASITDSAYSPDEDGLSIAIARCNYLAHNA